MFCNRGQRASVGKRSQLQGYREKLTAPEEDIEDDEHSDNTQYDVTYVSNVQPGRFDQQPTQMSLSPSKPLTSTRFDRREGGTMHMKRKISPSPSPGIPSQKHWAILSQDEESSALISQSPIEEPLPPKQARPQSVRAKLSEKLLASPVKKRSVDIDTESDIVSESDISCSPTKKVASQRTIHTPASVERIEFRGGGQWRDRIPFPDLTTATQRSTRTSTRINPNRKKLMMVREMFPISTQQSGTNKRLKSERVEEKEEEEVHEVPDTDSEPFGGGLDEDLTQPPPVAANDHPQTSPFAEKTKLPWSNLPSRRTQQQPTTSRRNRRRLSGDGLGGRLHRVVSRFSSEATMMAHSKRETSVDGRIVDRFLSGSNLLVVKAIMQWPDGKDNDEPVTVICSLTGRPGDDTSFTGGDVLQIVSPWLVVRDEKSPIYLCRKWNIGDSQSQKCASFETKKNFHLSKLLEIARTSWKKEFNAAGQSQFLEEPVVERQHRETIAGTIVRYWLPHSVEDEDAAAVGEKKSMSVIWIQNGDSVVEVQIEPELAARWSRKILSCPDGKCSITHVQKGAGRLTQFTPRGLKGIDGCEESFYACDESTLTVEKPSDEPFELPQPVRFETLRVNEEEHQVECCGKILSLFTRYNSHLGMYIEQKNGQGALVEITNLTLRQFLVSNFTVGDLILCKHLLVGRNRCVLEDGSSIVKLVLSNSTNKSASWETERVMKGVCEKRIDEEWKVPELEGVGTLQLSTFPAHVKPNQLLLLHIDQETTATQCEQCRHCLFVREKASIVQVPCKICGGKMEDWSWLRVKTASLSLLCPSSHVQQNNEPAMFLVDHVLDGDGNGHGRAYLVCVKR